MAQTEEAQEHATATANNNGGSSGAGANSNAGRVVIRPALVSSGNPASSSSASDRGVHRRISSQSNGMVAQSSSSSASASTSPSPSPASASASASSSMSTSSCASGRQLELRSPVGAESAFYKWPLRKGKGSMRRSEVRKIAAILNILWYV